LQQFFGAAYQISVTRRYGFDSAANIDFERAKTTPADAARHGWIETSALKFYPLFPVQLETSLAL